MPTRDDWNRLVNSKYPADMPTPTPEEAVRGARRLYRKAMGKPFRGKIKITSGNRHTWVRGGTLYVNPTYAHRPGWPGIVHAISHLAHYRRHPGKRPHSTEQLYLERDLAEYAIKAGFHLGKLKPKKRVEPKVDTVQKRYDAICARVERWDNALNHARRMLLRATKERRQYRARHRDRLS